MGPHIEARATTAAAAVEPDGAPRIAVLDMARGVAILGILFMNVNDVGGSMTASGGDIRHLGWTTADRIAWMVREVLANGTARGLLEMLFGAGMLILTDRIAARTQERWAVLRRYGWRNLVLWGFGMAHMFVLLWPGDILHSYAAAAMIACLFREWRARWLMTIGLAMAALQLLSGTTAILDARAGIAARHAIEARHAAGAVLTPPDARMLADLRRRDAARAAAAAADRARIADEDRYGRGSAADWAAGQRAMSLSRLADAEVATIWEAAGTMLIGAALFRLGILQGLRSRRFYRRLLVAAYAVGLALRGIDAVQVTRFDGLPHIGWATGEAARLVMTLGHVAAINLLARSAAMRPFVAAGRTALTLYVLQTIVMSWIVFPPFGLGLYGRFGWAGLMLLALGVDALLLWGATAYLRHFRIAPVEWAWRSLVERRRLPFRPAAPG